MKSISSKITKERLTILIFGIIFLGLISVVYTFVYTDRSLKQTLLQRTKTVAETLDPREVSLLKGLPEEETDPTYIELKRRLHNVVLANPDTRFVYLMGWRNDDPFFFVDSEPTDSKDISLPGDVYDTDDQILRDIFITKKAVVDSIFTDEWGTWFTGLAPIVDPDTGNLIAVVGMDIDAYKYFYTLATFVAVPAIVFSLLILLAFSMLYLRNKDSEELNLKSELVSIASHEIRTPLTGISWAVDSLLQHPEIFSKDQKEDVLTIKTITQRLLAIVNDLLELSSAENTKSKKVIKQQIVMLPFLKDIAKNLELSFREKNIALVLSPSFTPDVVIVGDTDKIKRMFNNLISNAIKYSKNDGVVQIDCLVNGKNVVFSVKDNGIGIPVKEISRIFEGFYRAENTKNIKEGGTGLGLRYARQIAELHGGKLWCESQEGVGSIFYVKLPKAI
jgi:signal transduction histidine kinase